MSSSRAKGLIFQNFVWNISHSKNSASYDHKCIGLYVNYSLLLSDFNQTWNFSTDFRKTLECQIFWKCIVWGTSCSIRTSGRTDRQKTERHDESNSRLSHTCERVWTLSWHLAGRKEERHKSDRQELISGPILETLDRVTGHRNSNVSTANRADWCRVVWQCWWRRRWL